MRFNFYSSQRQEKLQLAMSEWFKLKENEEQRLSELSKQRQEVIANAYKKGIGSVSVRSNMGLV
jgi:flagellar biosynthesis chaperone FliJ